MRSLIDKKPYNPNIRREAYNYVVDIMDQKKVSPEYFDISDMDGDHLEYLLGIIMKHPETFDVDWWEAIAESNEGSDILSPMAKALMNPYYNEELAIELKKIYRNYYRYKMEALIKDFMVEHMQANAPHLLEREQYPTSEFWGMNLGL